MDCPETMETMGGPRYLVFSCVRVWNRKQEEDSEHLRHKIDEKDGYRHLCSAASSAERQNMRIYIKEGLPNPSKALHPASRLGNVEENLDWRTGSIVVCTCLTAAQKSAADKI